MKPSVWGYSFCDPGLLKGVLKGKGRKKRRILQCFLMRRPAKLPTVAKSAANGPKWPEPPWKMLFWRGFGASSKDDKNGHQVGFSSKWAKVNRNSVQKAILGRFNELVLNPSLRASFPTFLHHVFGPRLCIDVQAIQSGYPRLCIRAVHSGYAFRRSIQAIHSTWIIFISWSPKGTFSIFSGKNWHLFIQICHFWYL